jgi:hypothetical protein
VDLADILGRAIEDRRALINQTAQRWPDRPIQIELSWMPQMGKLDLVVRAVDHLPPFRLVRPSSAAEGELIVHE